MNTGTIIIGIAGPSASGKSLLSNTIVRELGSEQVVVITEDSYYKNHVDLSPEERASINYDHPNAFDHELLCEHLMALQRGEDVEVPVYDFARHQRTKETRKVGKHSVTVLEGILLFVDPHLRELMHTRIFMDTPMDICFIRRLRRDMLERGRSLDSVIDQYKATVRPMYYQFIEPSKRYADIIVPRGGENRIAIDMIKAKLKEMISES